VVYNPEDYPYASIDFVSLNDTFSPSKRIAIPEGKAGIIHFFILKKNK